MQINARGQEQSRTAYRYDTFGRRVSKTHQTREQQSQTTHYGWDGDRLVHTETAEHIHHTVYEPGSFVPLLQMQRNKDKEGQTDPVKTLLNLGNNEASSPLEQELPREERELLHQALKEALQPGYRLSELMPQEMRAQVQESIQALKNARTQSEEQNPLAIRHVLTDHLGTPLALVNANGEQRGQVAWAARYTAWGQVEEEYNSNEIHQPIRFQGQQLDPETGLHYNRFRYYDPSVGRYLTQDPIGILGGINNYLYSEANPTGIFDAMGLAPGQAYPTQHEAAKSAINDINPTSIKRNTEFGGMICKDGKGKYSYTKPKKGDEDSVNPGGPTACPPHTKATAYYHTHGSPDPKYGAGNEEFSDPDKRYADRHGIDGYLGTPTGDLKHYSYPTGKDNSIGRVKTK